MVIEINFLGKFILNWLHVSSLEWEHDYAILFVAPVWLGPIDIWYKGVAFLFGGKKSCLWISQTV